MICAGQIKLYMSKAVRGLIKVELIPEGEQKIAWDQAEEGPLYFHARL
jgi:hypothetical protein